MVTWRLDINSGKRRRSDRTWKQDEKKFKKPTPRGVLERDCKMHTLAGWWTQPRGYLSLQKRNQEEQRKDFNFAWFRTFSINSCTFEQFKDIQEKVLFDLALQDNMLLPKGFTEYLRREREWIEKLRWCAHQPDAGRAERCQVAERAHRRRRDGGRDAEVSVLTCSRLKAWTQDACTVGGPLHWLCWDGRRPRCPTRAPTSKKLESVSPSKRFESIEQWPSRLSLEVRMCMAWDAVTNRKGSICSSHNSLGRSHIILRCNIMRACYTEAVCTTWSALGSCAVSRVHVLHCPSREELARSSERKEIKMHGAAFPTFCHLIARCDLPNCACKFPCGRWSFLGPGSGVRRYGTYSDKLDGVWDKTAQQMMMNFAKTSHPIFRLSIVFERGKLRSKGKGKKSVHFNGSHENIELLLRTAISANQLSVYGAVADLCNELSKDFTCFGETWSTWSFGNDGGSFWPFYCRNLYLRTATEKFGARKRAKIRTICQKTRNYPNYVLMRVWSLSKQDNTSILLIQKKYYRCNIYAENTQCLETRGWLVWKDGRRSAVLRSGVEVPQEFAEWL